MRATALVAGCLLTIASVVATPVPASAQAGVTLEDVRDQGILYFRKHLYKQAYGRLKAARKMPAGAEDFRTGYYLAQAAYELLLLEEAFATATEAKAAAGDNARRLASAKALLAQMGSLYGAVHIVRAPQEKKTRGRIFFEAKTGIINKDKKQRFLSIRERFRATDLALPATLYLPYGEYMANGVQFTIVQGEAPPSVPIFLQAGEDGAGDAGEGGSKLWWYVGGGVAAAAAIGVGTFFLLREPEPEQANISVDF